MKISFVAFLFLIILGSCSNNEPSKTAVIENELTANTPFSIDTSDVSILMIAHHVKDFDVWKASYDLAESVRLKHGINTKNVYQGKIDSNLAVVSAEIRNLDTAKYYVNSEDLYKSMQLSGVTGPIKTFYFTDKLNYTKEVTDTILMFMSFKVISFDRWQNAFLDDYKEDAKRDFQVIKVMQGIENTDEVAMLFYVNDPDYVKKMESNSSFRMKMIQSGVISYPVIFKLDNRLI